jgi:hypothetical protein
MKNRFKTRALALDLTGFHLARQLVNFFLCNATLNSVAFGPWDRCVVGTISR